MIGTFFDLSEKIFKVQNDEEFENLALDVFNYQFNQNAIYRKYCDLIKTDPGQIKSLQSIPFLPISFFKTHTVQSGQFSPEIVYTSSGTSGAQSSRHLIRSLSVYRQSFVKGFESKYGPAEDYIILGLLPSYLERDGSSLVYMVDHLIKASKQNESGFYLHNLDALATFLKAYQGRKKIMLIGVSYALLDLAEQFDLDLSNCIVMETGGMKGKRSEMTKSELHVKLKTSFNLKAVHSEYGMTELLSQAYAVKDGLFSCPKWMKIMIREHNDPFAYTTKKSGGINVIDLANISSCAFIATDDLGKLSGDSFEVLGRFDFADLRGCNLLIQ